MSATPSLTDERKLDELEAELRPLVAEVKAALADLMFAPGKEAVADLLTLAPVEPCVRFAETWESARASGVPADQVLPRFGPEEQFLIELVTSVYAIARPSPACQANLTELGRLLDETTLNQSLSDPTAEMPVLRPR